MLIQGRIYKYLIHLLLQQERNFVLIKYFIMSMHSWLNTKAVEKQFNMSNIII